MADGTASTPVDGYDVPYTKTVSVTPYMQVSELKGAEQYPWESQTMLVSFLGMLAGLAASMGWAQLTAEQIGIIGMFLFALVGALRKWSNGEKIVMKKV